MFKSSSDSDYQKAVERVRSFDKKFMLCWSSFFVLHEFVWICISQTSDGKLLHTVLFVLQSVLAYLFAIEAGKHGLFGAIGVIIKHWFSPTAKEKL